MKHKILSVSESSPLRGKAGPGDYLLSINGKKIRDVLDYTYLSYDSRLFVGVERVQDGRRVFRVRKGEGADLGLVFESGLMDGAMACRNKCVFCFIDQLPRGLRPPLYFKDDDARLSFLAGNYITLTNLGRRDIERITDLKISPVNISVHAANPELRAKMLSNPDAGACLPVMRRLARGGIKMNCQIVCCPGLNDGPELLRTLTELRELFPAVASVSVVPVGLTEHRRGLYPLSAYDAAAAGAVLDMADGFGGRCLGELGERLFYCADEFYLKAGRDIPPAEYYGDFPQLQNGVGMLRLFEDGFLAALDAAPSVPASGGSFSVATGVAAAGFLQKLVLTAGKKCDNINGTVYGVSNRFFGGGVNVAGLLTGRDLIDGLSGRALGGRLLIPSTMLRAQGDVFLDDMTPEELSGVLGVRIVVLPPDGEAFLREILK